MVLKTSGMNTPEMDEDYDNIGNIFEDNREVAWADQTMTSADAEVEPLEVIKNAENLLSQIKTSIGNYALCHCFSLWKSLENMNSQVIQSSIWISNYEIWFFLSFYSLYS